MPRKRIISILFTLVNFAAGLCARGHVFRVGLRYLPTAIDPRNNQINTNHYILLHLYFPLIEIDAGHLTSNFLDMKKTYSKDRSFRRYQFCLKDGLLFSDSTPISAQDLEDTLIQTHKVQEFFPEIQKISSNGSNCVDILLKASDSIYLHRFLGVASTILKLREKNRPFPTGLGPYKLVSVHKDKIVLDATAPAPKGPNYQFDRIEFILYRESLKIPLDDINHIYPRPKDINLASAETQKVQTPTFKSYVLVVNLPIESERKAIVECIDSEIFRTLVRPDLRQPTGFLPPGMYGAKANVRKLQRKSNQCKGLPSSTVNFVVLLASDENPARVALNKSSKSLAQIMKVNSVSSQSLANLIFDRKPKIVMVGLDSSGSISSNSHESSIFFEAFVRNKRMIKTPPPGLLNTVRKASLATQINEKKYLYSKAHEILLQSGYVIPIGYVDNDQIYPRYLKNIQWADRISGFPRIHDLIRTTQ